MSLSTHYLEYGSHVARLHHHRRHAYAPTSNIINHEKINSWVLFYFSYEYGAALLLIHFTSKYCNPKKTVMVIE